MGTKKSYKRTHSADAANYFVRNLLSEVGEALGGFTEDDWKEAKKFFGNVCAYTGLKGGLQQDHVVAHNRKHGGLHLRGNM